MGNKLLSILPRKVWVDFFTFLCLQSRSVKIPVFYDYIKLSSKKIKIENNENPLLS